MNHIDKVLNGLLREKRVLEKQIEFLNERAPNLATVARSLGSHARIIGDLHSALQAHEAEVKELVEAVREYRRAAHDETLAQDAHCEHSIGICWCGYKRALEDLDAILAKVTP